MSIFASARERGLWLGVGAVLVAAGLTLWLAGAWAEDLAGRARLDAAFLLGFLLTMAAIALGAVWQRPMGREVWVALGLAAVYGMVVVRMGIPLAERTHLFEYGLVVALVYQALVERRKLGRKVPLPALLAVLITSLLGWLDEAIQYVLPDRVYDVRDVAFNALASSMTMAIIVVLQQVRRWRFDGRRQ